MIAFFNLSFIYSKCLFVFLNNGIYSHGFKHHIQACCICAVLNWLLYVLNSLYSCCTCCKWCIWHLDATLPPNSVYFPVSFFFFKKIVLNSCRQFFETIPTIFNTPSYAWFKICLVRRLYITDTLHILKACVCLIWINPYWTGDL